MALTGIMQWAPGVASAQSTPAATTTPATAAPAAAGEKNWKDRAEYDLFEAARTGKDPKANLEKLDQWTKQYSETQFSKERRELYLTNYVAAGKVQDAVNVANEVLKDDPNAFTALYYITLYTPALVPAGSSTVPPELLDQGEKAANGMLTNLDKQKPATMSDAQWETAKKPIGSVAHTTLGWADMQRKDWEKAENEFKQSLALNPANGDVAYWLGISEAAEKKPEKIPEALFYFARTTAYDGPGAASPGNKTASSQYLDKAYASYHGGPDGLNELKQMAKNSPTPPPDFKIVSVQDKAAGQIEQENKLLKEHPELALFKNIKDALTGADGQSYFNDKMKDTLLPTLKGKVISMQPATNPKTVVLGILDPNTPDATLHFEAALAGKVEPGTELSFEGTAQSYTASPFMVNFLVAKDKIHGWTGKGAAPVRRAPARRPARR